MSVVATGVDENVSTLQPEEVAPNDMVSDVPISDIRLSDWLHHKAGRNAHCVRS